MNVLIDDRIKILDSINFVWNAKKDRQWQDKDRHRKIEKVQDLWQKYFNELVHFKEIHGKYTSNIRKGLLVMQFFPLSNALFGVLLYFYSNITSSSHESILFIFKVTQWFQRCINRIKHFLHGYFVNVNTIDYEKKACHIV